MKGDSKIWLLSLLVVLYYMRMAIPGVRYVFVPLLGVAGLALLVDIVRNFDKTIWTKGARAFAPILALCLLYFVGMGLSEHVPRSAWKEALNIPVIGILVLALLQWVRSEAKFNEFKSSFIRINIWLVVGLCFAAIVKLYLTMKGVEISFLKAGEYYPIGSSIMKDYNSFSLGVFVGLICLIFILYSREKKISLMDYGAILLMNTVLIYSSSRRGFLLILMLNATLLLLLYLAQNRPNISTVRVRQLASISVFSFVFNFLLLAGFPAMFKQTIWDWTGGHEKRSHFETSLIFYRYFSLVNKQHNFADQYEYFWFTGEEEEERDEFFADAELESMRDREYKNTTYSSRTARWAYGVELYTKEYTWVQRILGGGFDYLYKFQSRFEREKVGMDYPHNPGLSSLLYAGLPGIAAYLWYIILAIKGFYRKWEELAPFSLLFFFVLFFSQLSGNSFLSLPLFLFVTLIPLHFSLIRYD